MELDPDFGRAHARIAIHWVIMSNWGFARAAEANAEAERQALRAIELDGDLFEAHWALGWIQFVRHSWEDARASFRKVIELAPGNWEGYHSLGFLQGVMGQYGEAMTAAQIAIDLDPLAYWPRRGIEILYSRQRQWQESVDVVLELGARFGWEPWSRAWLGYLRILAGATEEGRADIAELEAGLSIGGNTRLALALAYSALGKRDKAHAIADAVRDDVQSGRDMVLPGTLAIAYACLENHDEAIGFLLQARENEDVELLFLDDRCFDGLRGDPRFVDQVRGMKLPEQIYLTVESRESAAKS